MLQIIKGGRRGASVRLARWAVAAGMAVGVALGPTAPNAHAYTITGAPGSTISTAAVIFCSTNFTPSGLSWAVEEASQTTISFPYASLPTYTLARRWLTLQQSPNGTSNWTDVRTVYQDTTLTYPSVMSGTPVFNFSPVKFDLNLTRGTVYMRIVDFHQLFTNASAKPAWQSPSWYIRDGYQTRLWNAWGSGYTYFSPGPCKLTTGT
jgi:hypothetical protein